MTAIIFDTETTDLIANPLINDNKQAHVVEFCGMIVEEDGEVSETLEFLCRPPVPMSKEAAQITGIRGAMLEDKLPYSHYADQVQAFFHKAKTCVAHNLFFDKRVIDMEYARIGKPFIWTPRLIDTVKETEWILGRRMKMGELYEYLFGERFAEAHRARNDVLALVRIYNELRKRGLL